MKYPIIQYGHNEEFVKAMIFFKGQEYTLTEVEEKAELRLDPPNKFIEALLKSDWYCDIACNVFGCFDEDELRSMQDDLQRIERTGESIHDPEDWEKFLNNWETAAKDEMKYPVLQYRRDEFGDKELVKAIVLFKGQEYTFTYTYVDNTVSSLLEPPNEIIDAVLNNTLFQAATPECSCRRIFRALQNELCLIERLGYGAYFIPKSLEKQDTMDKAG